MSRTGLHDGALGDLLRRLGDHLPADADHAGGNRLLRLGAGLDQAMMNQVEIGAHHNTTR